MGKLKELFKNKKFVKIFIIVLVLAIALGIFLYVRLSDKGTKVNLVKVKRGNITDYYETNAIIDSNGKNSYMLSDGVKVTQLNVKLGDKVKEGQVLAKFDTTALQPLINEKRKEYNQAMSRYNSTVNSIDTAKKQRKEIEKQIKQLESMAQSLREQISKSSSKSTTSAPSMTEDELKKIIDATGGNSTSLTPEQIDEIMSKINSAGDVSDTSLEAQLKKIELQISLLESQKSVLNVNGASSSLVDTYKKIADYAKESLEELENQKAELDKGWQAEEDGVVSELNIEEGMTYKQPSNEKNNQDILSIIGESSSKNSDVNKLLQQMTSSQQSSEGVGMVVDNLEDYCVTFNVGKYDSQRIKLNMPSKIEYLSYDYEGYVSYISKRAKGSSSGLSKIAGGASSSSNTLKAKVAITNPDENLTVGFDAKLLIKTDEVKNALIIPIEALQGNTKEKYVFVYNPKNKTVNKKLVKIGVASDKYYEIKSGLKEGDQVVKNLPSNIEDGAKVYVGD